MLLNATHLEARVRSKDRQVQVASEDKHSSDTQTPLTDDDGVMPEVIDPATRYVAMPAVKSQSATTAASEKSKATTSEKNKAATMTAKPAKSTAKTVTSTEESSSKKEDSLVSDLSAAPVVQPSAHVESQMIDSMLKTSEKSGDFPAKANYISSEESVGAVPTEMKNDAVTAVSTATVTPEATSVKKPVLVAKDSFSEATPYKGPEVSYQRVILSTLTIVLLMTGLAYFWRYLQGKGGLFSGANGQLKILAQQPINVRSKILIIEALNKKYLVGATPERIQLLADLDLFSEGAAEQPEMPSTSLNDFDLQMAKNQTTTQGTRVQKGPPTHTAVFSANDAKNDLTAEFETLGTESFAERIKEKMKNLKKISS